MKSTTRTAVAGICAAIVNDKRVTSVYSFDAAGYTPVNAEVKNEQVTCYDYGASCHINGRLPNVYHYGDGHHIQLIAKGKTVNGYDHGSASHFTATVNGHSVQIYDHGDAGYFNFTVVQ